VLLSACSTAPVQQTLPDAQTGIPELTKGLSWKTCYAKINLDENGHPDWAVDLFLAHSVFAPVLTELGSNMPRWRFHRRAVRDEDGHRFSFIFYTDFDTAIQVNELLENNSMLKQALAEGILKLFYCNSPDDEDRPGVEDTSDPAWSESLQRSWPAYIMGVSSMWLALVNDSVGDVNNESTMDEILAQYRLANEQVTATWRTEGQHALLHHLNAIFGYQPLNLNKSLSF
jgi:hypothetical protein